MAGRLQGGSRQAASERRHCRQTCPSPAPHPGCIALHFTAPRLRCTALRPELHSQYLGMTRSRGAFRTEKGRELKASAAPPAAASSASSPSSSGTQKASPLCTKAPAQPGSAAAPPLPAGPAAPPLPPRTHACSPPAALPHASCGPGGCAWCSRSDMKGERCGLLEEGTTASVTAGVPCSRPAAQPGCCLVCRPPRAGSYTGWPSNAATWACSGRV